MPLPRLIVVDFVKGTSQKTDEGRDSSVRMASKSRKVLRPKTATKSRDRLQVDENALNEDDQTDWTQESFQIRLLCEYEGGWHLSTKTYPLAFRTRDSMEQFLSKAAPYLYRIYTILKQSPIKLKCFTGPTGDTYQKWITEQSEENLDFVGAMMHLRSHLATDEAADFVSTLARCRLPSGKIVWLCDKHQKEEHIAKLSTGSRGSSYNVTKVLFNEDKYFLENLEKSEIYKKLKAVKSNNVAPKLPQPVAYSNFLQMPAPPPPDADDKTKNRAQSPIKRDDKNKSNSPEKSSNQNKDVVKSPKPSSANNSSRKSPTANQKLPVPSPVPGPANQSSTKDKHSLKAVGHTADLTANANARMNQKASNPKSKACTLM